MFCIAKLSKNAWFYKGGKWRCFVLTCNPTLCAIWVQREIPFSTYPWLSALLFNYYLQVDILETVHTEPAVYISPKRQAELTEIFELFESEIKDLMRVTDLGHAIKCLGAHPTDEEIRVLIRSEGTESSFLSGPNLASFCLYSFVSLSDK